MKFQNRLKALFLAATIEFHWRSILRHRRRGDRLLAAGAPLNCKRMLRLDRRIMRHSLPLMEQEKYFAAHFVPPARGRV